MTVNGVWGRRRKGLVECAPTRGRGSKPLNPIPKGILIWEGTHRDSELQLEIFGSILSGNHVAAMALALFANKMMGGRHGQVFPDLSRGGGD